MENSRREATRLTSGHHKAIYAGQSGKLICKIPYEFIRAHQTQNHRPDIKEVYFLTTLVTGSLRSKC